jgi:hypothetical protein
MPEAVMQYLYQLGQFALLPRLYQQAQARKAYAPTVRCSASSAAAIAVL